MNNDQVDQRLTEAVDKVNRAIIRAFKLKALKPRSKMVGPGLYDVTYRFRLAPDRGSR